jgi:DNA-binding CsgD family transcriptional regulator
MFRRARGLTKTELVVLSMIAGGLTNRSIAKRLGVSHRTVENHRQRLRNKLGIRDTAALIHEAAQIGLVR